MASYARPPSVAPKKLPPSKPRSYTALGGLPTEALSSTDSSGEGTAGRCESFSSGVSDSSLSSVGDNHVKPVKRPPPPKPKPLTTTSSGGNLNRRFNFDTQEVQGGSPPPPPPPRRESSQVLLSGKQTSLDASVEDYSLLADAISSPPTVLGKQI